MNHFQTIMSLVLLLACQKSEAFTLGDWKRTTVSPKRQSFVVHSNPNINSDSDTSNSGLLDSSKSDDFWNQQKQLAQEMSSESSKSLRQIQQDKFEARRLALVYDTAQFAVFIFCGCWMLFENPFTAFSYAFGAAMGLAYSYGLGKSVESIGQSIDDLDGNGAGVGEARFAFLILLFVFVGKFRGETGLQEIPSIGGFFTYQLASLNQGLREIND